MIFKDLPEFVSEKTVYQTLSFCCTVEDKLEYIEKDFEHIISAELIEDLHVLRFWNGNMLMFSYRDDGLKLITAYQAPERFVIVIYDKDLYEFMVRQGSGKEDIDYVVPKFNKAKFEPLKDNMIEEYLSSIIHNYCRTFVCD